jgi:hypothetical protein
VEDYGMVAYEFYRRDSVEGYQHIGTLPERRMNPVRITEESVMNWAREILANSIDFNNLFFITIRIDKNSGKIVRFKEKEEGLIISKRGKGSFVT